MPHPLNDVKAAIAHAQISVSRLLDVLYCGVAYDRIAHRRQKKLLFFYFSVKICSLIQLNKRAY